ncbi:MAG TPA: RNA polymerase sigma factor [Gemmatimonadaceae bacterium]|nr:RNA polymerase sigma factor [Gemmatimonadaceae bacterium]
MPLPPPQPQLESAGVHPDAALVARAQQGQLGAYEALYRAHAGRVYALCLRLSGDRERARELTQDVFVRAWERLGGFAGASAFATWLHRLTVNLVLERERSEGRRARRVRFAGDTSDDTALDASAPPPAMSLEERIDFERAVATLPAGLRTVYVLHDIEGYKHGEIARLTGVAEGTTRAQLHQARRKLMEMLSR